VLVLLGGCQETSPAPRTAYWACGFGPEQIRLQPSFTKVLETKADASNGGGLIEAYIELRDQFGDPIKALGKFRVEMFKYRPAFSDPRGQRFPEGGIQEIDLSGISENQRSWDSITRSYHLSLPMPKMSSEMRQFVLQVTFTGEPERRLQDILVVERKGQAGQGG
jgi:hypothetical protein